MTLILFFDRIGDDSESLYQDYLESVADDEENLFSKLEIKVSNIVTKIAIVCVVPATVLIYRSRLLTLQAFQVLKKHQGERKGVAYNRCLQILDIMFCCTSLRTLNYIEYIKIRRKYSQKWGKQAETASVTILVIWISIQYYYDNIEEFSVPRSYLILLLMLLLQKIGMFFLKLALFPVCYLAYAIICVCLRCCRRE